MLTKNEVIKSLQSLPEKFQAEEAIERIVFLEKIRIGIEQSENGKVLNKDKAMKRLSKWLKKTK
jgi:predicted transcriptional regulator